MKITADANLLLRVITEDDARQAAEARTLMAGASLIAIPVVAICEVVWTLKRLYKRQPSDIARAVEALLLAETVVTDKPAVQAGLSMLRAGGDFADGVIAFQGAALGSEIFATFDRDAIPLLNMSGLSASEPGKLFKKRK